MKTVYDGLSQTQVKHLILEQTSTGAAFITEPLRLGLDEQEFDLAVSTMQPGTTLLRWRVILILN